MKRIVILGASGHARVISDIISASGDTVEAFLDDNTSIVDVAGPISEYERYKDCEFVIGIGSTIVRERLSNLPVKWYTAIHPTSVVSPKAIIGEGTVIMPNAVVNSGVVLGKHTIINTGAIVEHDSVIEDFVHVSVGAKLGGTVQIGKSTWIGIGATVSNNIQICSDCMIGAGAVVVRDIEMKGKYIGLPAKIIGGGGEYRPHNFCEFRNISCCLGSVKEAA